MAKKIALILSLATLSLGFIWSCSERVSPYDPDSVIAGGISPKKHVFTQELLMQLRNKYQLIKIEVYMPRASFPLHYGGSGSRDLPLLILLPPHGESAEYYLSHGLKELADEMISTGEIVPMYIATIPADPSQAFGGYFYAGDSTSYPSGDYDKLIGQSLPDYLAKVYEYPSSKPELHGIGGVGTGAYGAFRAALVHPGAFASITVADGPLDFDGSPGLGNGLIDLMSRVVTEEQPGMTNDSIFRARFDSAASYPISRLFIGGAEAFSPHDTALIYTLEPHTNTLGQSELLIHIDSTTRGKPDYAIQDTVTFITRLVTEDVRNFDFHLPFDYTGTPYPPIWNLWLRNNLENMMTGGELDGVAMWIATTPEANWGYYGQTQSWIKTLRNNGYSPTVVPYEGYGGNPASSDRYVYELLRAMLKFHSEKFKQYMGGE